MDLHIHTMYSDGSDDLSTILNKSQKLGLKYISITDHDNCDAYDELKNINNNYSFEIIPGIEITAAFNNQRIDILAYNFDNMEIVNEYFKKYRYRDWKPIKLQLRKELLIKLDKLNLKYDDKFKDKDFQIEYTKYETLLYESLLELNPNLKDVIKDDYCDNSLDFFRKCVCNPNSNFYMNYISYYPNLKDIVNLIHENNGICLLILLNIE